MTIKMWDLAAAEDDRRFTEKETIAVSGQGMVPVLVDDGKEVHASWSIAEYLEERYPAKPLFESAQAKSLAFVFKTWVESSVHGPILRGIVVDLFNALHEKDQPYFRESREKRLGKTLDEPDDPVYAWRERMLDLYDGLAREAEGYPVWA